MAARSRSKISSSFLVILLIAAAIVWLRDAKNDGPSSPPNDRPTTAETSPSSSRKAPLAGPYEVYENCRLIDHGSNDGDSFLLQLPDGRRAIFRLYYVDTPESKFRRYQNGETNSDRIHQQARDLGNLTPERAVEIGQQAKNFTLDLLKNAPFTLYTSWDSPYNDQRYHAFLQCRFNNRTIYLHELLIEKGLARIKTKPAPLPDGTSVDTQRKHLRALEAKARNNRAGAWR
ncbi:MAG: thermonuclease family protein [Luteolibacter sp.]